jgi:signal transduction protein with GAF and PtsI domain
MYLVNPNEQLLELAATVGYDWFTSVQVPRGKGASGIVWQTGAPLWVEEYATWPQWLTGLVPKNFQTVVAMPLVSGASVVGVLGLWFEGQPRPYNAAVEQATLQLDPQPQHVTVSAVLSR